MYLKLQTILFPEIYFLFFFSLIFISNPRCVDQADPWREKSQGHMLKQPGLISGITSNCHHTVYSHPLIFSIWFWFSLCLFLFFALALVKFLSSWNILVSLPAYNPPDTTTWSSVTRNKTQLRYFDLKIIDFKVKIWSNKQLHHRREWQNFRCLNVFTYC